jgi:hypothetical protein
MTKKIIALQGVSNVGKSETIKNAYELLRAKYLNATILIEEIYKVDITVILIIKNVKIGIESQGDPNGRLVRESLARFVRQTCQIIICDTRKYGQTVDAVNKLRQKHEYEVVWLQQGKAEPSAQHASNLEMAKRIIREVEEIINA